MVLVVQTSKVRTCRQNDLRVSPRRPSSACISAWFA